MAKKGSNQSGGRDGPSKHMIGKKLEIQKLIQAKQATPPATKKPRARKGRRQPEAAHNAGASGKSLSRPEPKPIVPGLCEPHYLVLDRRHEEAREVVLVRLPDESAMPRGLRRDYNSPYLPDPAFVPQGQFPFFALPGELRNRIYDFAMAKRQYSIGWVNQTQRSRTLTFRLLGLPKTDHQQPRLHPKVAQHRRHLDYQHRRLLRKHIPVEDLHAGPAAMLLVSKSMHDEAASVFYSKSFFIFYGIGTLRHFLNHLTPKAKTSITKLDLRYRAYGHPRLTENQWIKDRHDRSWENLCWRITDECISLTHLSLDLTLNISPLSFAPFDQIEDADIGAHWIKPLWAFQDVGIERCWGRIRSATQDDTVLEVESWKMRKEILGDAWDDEAEAHRSAYGRSRKTKEDVAKKGMVLRLRVDGGLETF